MPEDKKPKEEAPESPVPGQIELHPTAYTYVVEVSGEQIGTEDPVMAVVLSMLEKNSQELKAIHKTIRAEIQKTQEKK